jgi:hypothetical protein
VVLDLQIEEPLRMRVDVFAIGVDGEPEGADLLEVRLVVGGLVSDHLHFEGQRSGHEQDELDLQHAAIRL